MMGKSPWSLLDDRFFGGDRHFRLGAVDRFANVEQRLIEVVLGVELDHHGAAPSDAYR